jgi:hypothetical protein
MKAGDLGDPLAVDADVAQRTVAQAAQFFAGLV